jgi:predicted AlkP superfamily phosphohydrolase/phosphomutase
MSQFVPFDRILILGLDSVCWEVLQPLIDDGTMPALGSFLKRAHYGELESTIPPHTAAAWSTFLTGEDPGRHGIIDFVKYNPKENRFRFHASSVTREHSFMTRLSKVGITCGSIFLPRHYPPYPLKDGYVISGFETPSTQVQFTEPDELRTEVLGVSPEMHFNFEDDWQDDKTDKGFASNIERAIESVDRLEQLSVHLQRERPVRVQISYLQTTDILFHKAWKWCCAKASVSNEYRRGQIKQFFRRVDQLVSRVLGLHNSRTSQRFKPNGGERILRMIVSDHGHGSSNGRVFVNKMLAEWGYLKPLGGFSRVSRKISLLTMDASARREKNRELQVDWTQTQAYLAHVGIYGFVYINLKGREAHGCVAKKDFEKVRNELIAKFADAKIPKTKDPLFPHVLKGEEVFEKKDELMLPDIVLVPADGFYPRKKLTDGDAIRVTPNSVGGVHREQGVYAFEGPGVLCSKGLGERANIVDIAPTVLAALGQPIPTTMTGNALLYVFGENPPNADYVEEDGNPKPTGHNDAVYTKEQEKEIEKRLADLGYLE